MSERVRVFVRTRATRAAVLVVSAAVVVGFAAAINEPDTRQRLEKMGYIVDPGQPEALAARLAAESQTLERTARDAKIVPQ